MAARRSIYLDYSASTPTDQRVVAAMLPYFTEDYGNSSSAHGAGRTAERAVENARETIAAICNCPPSAIVFTSGGTESDNLALRGAALARRGHGTHLVSTPIEHSAVTRTLEQLSDHMGFSHTLLPVDHHGRVDPEVFADALTPQTTVASVMYVNNEIGTIQPIPQLAEHARARGVLFHTDAVQAAGQLTLDVEALGVDLLAISAHKFYGPKGVGALYVRPGIDLLPSQSGGSHERYRRAGTLNTPGIVGMAAALKLCYDEQAERLTHYRALRDRIIGRITSEIPGAYLTGDPVQRLPSHASFIFDAIDANRLLVHLDLKGVMASSASACKTGNPEPSGVLLALGYPRELAASSLRLSVGKDTTVEDVDHAVTVLADAIAKLRRLH